tara:strand:+ start:1683 stop:2405 length:723 start_codon:yes stop_codon:yes gene_type:complete
MIIEIFILAFLTIFQSIFGIGLLVFGTPTFLLLEYTFTETLSIVLPISCFVSLSQIIVSKKTNIKNFTSDFFKFSLPALILSLPFAILIMSKTNINILIAIIMIVISILSIWKIKNSKNIYEKFKFKKMVFFFIGCVHGLTNLGGGLISIFSSFYYPENKIKIRYSIAVSYSIFSLFQLTILFLLDSYYFRVEFLLFILIIPFIFFLSNLIFNKISKKNFSIYIYYIVLFYGLFVLIKNI